VALRDTTERHEAVEAGAVELVGCDALRIETSVARLLTDPQAYRAMQVETSPFGDGLSAQRIVAWMLERPWLQSNPETSGVERPCRSCA
jgi:UDP-N-acetylglucosamine 2-epimerase (non-hydrolysing)